VVDGFIRDYLEYNFLPTPEDIRTVITHIREREGKAPLSEKWFSTFWTRRGLHKIKTKPIAVVRVTAQDKKEVIEWFEGEDGYFEAIYKYDIHDNHIHNFDETGVRISCPHGIEVVVPIKVKELYSLSPENRKSLTVIEDISAMNVEKIPPVIIV
jgi:hypothetical protein